MVAKQILIRSRNIINFFDKLSFLRLFIIWFCIVLGYGCFYYFFHTETSFLLYASKGLPVNDLSDSIFFSIFTAITISFGDVIPVGIYKLVAVIEILTSLMLLAVVTSKIVSLKQGVILSELYEISFKEKVNNLRSSLLLFRQNLTRIIDKIEDATIRKREIADIYMYISAFEDSLNDILLFIERPSEDHFTKKIDSVNTELICISVLNSFEKVNDLIATMNQANIEWRGEITISLLKSCINTNESIFKKIATSRILMEKTLENLNSRKNEIIPLIKKAIELKST